MEGGSVVQLFLALGLIIGAAQLAGSAARSVGQPRVFGELLAGVFLGPTLLNLLHWGIFDNPEMLGHTIKELAELGVLFLMFAVGLEVHLPELLSVGKVAILGGTLGAVLPLVASIPIVAPFGYSVETAIFVGVVMSATSVSISAQTLLELGVLRTKEGVGLLAMAVADDILAILLVSIVIATLGPNTEAASVGELLWIFVRMMLYLAGALLVAWFVLPRLFAWLHRRTQFTQSMAAFALIAALLFGWSAEVLGGVAAITGAFITGMGLSRTTERIRHQIENAVRPISYSFLVPIFFVNVGLQTDLTSIGGDMIPLAILLLVVAVVTKVVGCGFGARLGGFTSGESLRVGVCMISRGEVGLIIASLLLSAGMLEQRLFEPVFLVILLTTVITPPLVRLVFRNYPTAIDPGPPRTARDTAAEV
ncbi:MAG: cation:proton antiporter [Chloroflexi bacterium]|nr:cation:proton antiporter [Chloroflexota bacterium]